jgi:hypothetical protein
MMRILKRIGGVAAVPVYLAGMFALGIAGFVLKRMKARQKRKLEEERRRSGRVE